MLGENKNLKDVSQGSFKDTLSDSVLGGKNSLAISSGSQCPITYTKTNKLISALYMVTDIMEKEEPMRLKLRTLGVEILSDINSFKRTNAETINQKINTVLSFLNITSDLRMISEMNSNILIKEFNELKKSINDNTEQNDFWLGEFLNKSIEEESSIEPVRDASNVPNIKDKFTLSINKGQSPSKGQEGVRIGVQKGSTLLRALNNIQGKQTNQVVTENSFGIIKNKRRELILKIIKDKNGGVSIKDIFTAMSELGEVIGEKTLQRELVSLVSDNILYRIGSKRWSHYFLKN